MSLKNLSVNKIPKILSDNLSNKKIWKLYKEFERNFDIEGNFAVAVSGGPDSLALAFLSKVYSTKYKLKTKYFIVDHKLRKESTKEALKVKKILNNLSIKSDILTWRKQKTRKNTQSESRKNRYNLLFSECKKFKITNLILGHHLDDQFENFFIRMIRGSGLKGLTSFGKKTQIDQINLFRPLIEFKKKDLIFISSHVFNFFVEDPSNDNEKYTRTKIRNLIENLKNYGFDKEKLFLTISNLKKSDEVINSYVEINKKKNSFLNLRKKELILNDDFFNQPYEIVFRSISDSIKFIGKSYSPVRGKKIDNIIQKIKNGGIVRVTLGGCVIKKVNQTVFLSKEY